MTPTIYHVPTLWEYLSPSSYAIRIYLSVPIDSRCPVMHPDIYLCPLWWRATAVNSPLATIHYKVTSNEHEGVSNHLQFDCLFNSLLRLTTKKPSNSTLLGFCDGIDTNGFPSQRASNAEIVSISWSHHDAHGCGLAKRDMLTCVLECTVHRQSPYTKHKDNVFWTSKRPSHVSCVVFFN